MIDHDALFKQLLTTFFNEFLALFAPDVSVLLDVGSLTFLDKESFAEGSERNRREADLIARAQLAGQPAFLIIHLEHQAQPDKAIDRRMFRYFSRLYDHYDVPVYPIVLCSYASPRKPVIDRHGFAVAGLPVLEFRYHIVQLNLLDWRGYLRSENPLVVALMARMQIAKRDRVRVKLECLKLLSGLSLDVARKRILGSFVDIYLQLDEDEQQIFRQTVQDMQPEEERAMLLEHVPSWERWAIEDLIAEKTAQSQAEGFAKGQTEGFAKGQTEGRAEGRAEGEYEQTQRLTQRLLTRKLGALPDELLSQIQALQTAELELLSESLLDFTELDNLRDWLSARSSYRE